MGIELNILHFIYLIFIFLILGFMILRKDTSMICILGIFVLGLAASLSMTKSVTGIFDSLIFALHELMSTILIISIISGMSRVLMKTGVNEVMVKPFKKIIKTPTLAFWIIGFLMMVISWFFWPSPAVALMGAVLLPAALSVGLPAIGVAAAMNLFGHGIALSGDFIIQGAPKLTADAAGLAVSEVISASIPLVIVMGIVTTVTAFILLKRDMKNGKLKAEQSEMYYNNNSNIEKLISDKSKKISAVIIPLLFVLDIVAMSAFNLQGGDAAALIGGTAVIILVVLSMMAHKKKGLEKITEYLIEGFQFGFKIFGPVIPIAAFFYLGDSAFSAIFGCGLPETSAGIVNDLGAALANSVPINKSIGAGTLTLVGAITGLDGSGFSGISLAGSAASIFSTAIGYGTATLTALGQIAAIWVGGGTLVPWALLPAAAVCGINPFDLAKRNLIPVVIGLIVTTIAAIIIL